MEPVFGLLGALLVGSVAFLVSWGVRLERTSRLARLAEDAGLTGIERRSLLGLGTGVAARAGRFAVRLEPSGRSDWDEGLRIVIGGLGHGPFGLVVRPESAGAAFEKVFDGGEIVLGDPGFDGAALVRGEAALARAVLAHEVRRSLQELLGGTLRLRTARGEEVLPVSVQVSGDELTVDVRRNPSGAEGWLREALSRLTALAEGLVPPADVAAAIAGRASTEPDAGVRLANLRLVARDFSGHPATAAALRAGCRDPDDEVRLEAALALGAEGQGVLRDLAASDRAREALAARAVEALGAAFGVDDAVRALGEALASGRARVAAACAGALAKLGGEAADRAEPALVAALAHETSEVRAAAAEALGEVGTPRAVLPLQECAAAHPLDLSVRRSAREAVARIQSRVEGGSPGQLSLAEGDAGRLSLAEEGDAAGRLSLEANGERRRETAARAGTLRTTS